jgi:hypothetical protein
VACQFTPVFEDSGAEHQIILRRAANRKLITVGCTCRRMTIESRPRWGAGEAAAAWRAWHEQQERATAVSGHFADELNGYFADRQGFHDPDKAARHAVMIQGGYSTPLREAARMIKDGGVHAERARAWMEAHGYTDADLEE